MNKVENLFLENIQSNNFHNALNDNFDFVDSLIEQSDLDSVEEDNNNE